MADIEEEKQEKTINHGNTRLPFGLCKRYGIDLPENATPREAWDALYNNTGIQPKQAYADLKQSSATRKVISIQESALKYLNDKGISRYDKTTSSTDQWAEKKYYEIMSKYDNGEKLELRLNGTLKQRLLSYIENKQVNSAKRILRLDSDEDTNAEQKYWDRNTELIKFLSTTTPKTEPVNSQEESELEKKKSEAIAYFRKYVERKKKLQAEGKYEEREITSSTYKRAQNRLNREVAQWFSGES